METFVAIEQNMKSLLQYANEEFNQYKETDNVVFLQQAGEKLFASLENYAELVTKVQIESYGQLQSIVKEKPLRKLLRDALHLHRFFYHGELYMTKEDAEDEFIRISSLLEQRIKRLQR